MIFPLHFAVQCASCGLLLFSCSSSALSLFSPFVSLHVHYLGYCSTSTNDRLHTLGIRCSQNIYIVFVWNFLLLLKKAHFFPLPFFCWFHYMTMIHSVSIMKPLKLRYYPIWGANFAYLLRRYISFFYSVLLAKKLINVFS